MRTFKDIDFSPLMFSYFKHTVEDARIHNLLQEVVKEWITKLEKATDFGKENDELEELGFFYADIDGYDGAAQILKMIFNLDKDEPDNLLPSLEGKEAIKIDGKRKDFLYLKQDVEDNCVDKKLLLKEIERYPEEHTRMKSKLKSIFGL